MNEVYGAWVSELSVKPARAAFAAAAPPVAHWLKLLIQAQNE